MQLKKNLVNAILTVSITTLVLGVLACGHDRERNNTTDFPGIALPASFRASEASTSETSSVPPTQTLRGGYVAKKLPPGGYPDYVWDGPIPSSFQESPQSAELVMQGKILPLAQRLPGPEDILVVPPDDEIGIYGGTMRITTAGLGSTKVTSFSKAGCFKMDPDGISRSVNICMEMRLSEDGKVYTFKLRKGARWSDGYPLTIKDFRFAWEDLNYNREYTPFIPIIFSDPVTGNRPKFKILDDLTWSLTFESPNYTVIESKEGAMASGSKGCGGSYLCFYSAAHIYKRYHPRYAASGDLKDEMKFQSVEDWTRLMRMMQGMSSFEGVPYKPVPTEYDPEYVYDGDHYTPYMGGYITTVLKDQATELARNHYSVMVDPNGNQLPYLDSVITFIVESRDVSVFKSVGGESDVNGIDLIQSEFPLYLANMEKGDYSVQMYRGASGGDVVTRINQEYNEDPEIGRLLRSQDYRTALSLGWNRVAVNETIYSGLGTPQNWVPHPSTPYYPGLEWANLDAVHDVERANKLLDSLGFVDIDGDGIRNRTDGAGNLQLYFEADRVYFPVIQLLQTQWKELGILLHIREGARAFRAAERNKQYFVMGGSSYGVNPWSVAWTPLAPLVKGHSLAPTIGEYYQTRGREGMAPDGPDDSYLPLAPEGTYPADSSGNLKHLQDLWGEGLSIQQYSPRRIELGKQIFKVGVTEKYNIGGLAFTGIGGRGIRIKRNNFRNTPRNHFPTSVGGYAEAYCFEDGIDNYHNPGNRSKKYKSINFLDPAYWD